MKNNLIAQASVIIDAGTAQVWKVITTPEMIKQYLMGTHVSSNWKEGSAITYEGEYNGKKYKDKGVIKKFEPGKIFQSTYWSSMGGKEDKPENYNLVTYELEDKDGRTVLTISQDNNHSEKEKEHAIENWKSVLTNLKTLAEQNEKHFA